MAGHVYLVFQLPSQAKEYFVREAEKMIGGRGVIIPETSTEVRHGHRFNPESAVVFRDRYRDQFSNAKSKYEIFIEDTQGNRQFEREAQPESPTEDDREPVFVLPDGYESTGLGFLVCPARRPTGPCWCIRAADVPSMRDRASAVETIFGDDPVSTVNRMLATWGSLAVPSRAPWADQQDAAEAHRILREYEKSKLGPGRRRPGDR